MVEIIGIATIVALVWLLDASMANESDAEQRRLSGLSVPPPGTDLRGAATSGKGKRAAA